MSIRRQFRPAAPAATRSVIAGLLVLASTACDGGVGPSGAQEQLLYLSHADGATTGVWHSRQRDIYRANPDGTGARNLTNHPGDYASLSLSPDRRRVTFQHIREGFTHHIWAMNTDGTGLRDLGAGLNPRWSPDGALIAYQYGHVYVVNPNGGAPLKVSGGVVGSSCSTEPERLRIELIGWLPGGKIAFSRYYCGEGYRFYTVNADGTGFAQRTDLDLNTAYWSPDGTRVAFTRTDESRTRKLYVMNADGTGERLLTEQGTNQYLPSRTNGDTNSDYTPWSPDGSRIVAYLDASTTTWGQTEGCTGTSLPYVVKVDGTGLQKLSDVCGFLNGWSPTGSRIALSMAHHPTYNVFTVRGDGTGLAELTSGGVPVSHALWVRE